mgnify:FL=1
MSYALGLDIGTTFTAAAVDRDGVTSIVQLGTNRAAVPSVVVFRGDDTVLTGDAAERRSRTEPDRVAREFKRRFGDATPVFIGGTPRSPELITSRLLRDVVDTVSEREGGPPADGIVVTHPASWGEYKLGVLRQAVRLAGLTDVTFLAEPIAAAVHYSSLERVPDGAVLAVYDLGGGTFDAAIVEKRGDRFEILGQPEGIERLGGIDFDAAVLEHVRVALGDAIDQLDPTGTEALRLREECITAKEALSTDTDVSISVLAGGVEHQTRLTRAEFEEMIRPVLTSTVDAMRRALESASVTADRLDAILLVGGGSRIPIVAEMITNEFGRPVAVDAHPKHSIALGAARFGAGTSPRVPVAPVPAASPAPPPTSRTSTSSRRWWIAATAVVAVAAVAAFAWARNESTGSDAVATSLATESTVAPTTAPPATDPPPTNAPTTQPVIYEGDLGLATPMTRPDCDDQNITVLFSAIDPASYAEQVAAKLAEFEGSSYLRTAITCPSLRAQFVDGSDIYVVYFGPFESETEACGAKLFGPPDAYVKKLSLTTPVEFEVSCT